MSLIRFFLVAMAATALVSAYLSRARRQRLDELIAQGRLLATRSVNIPGFGGFSAQDSAVRVSQELRKIAASERISFNHPDVLSLAGLTVEFRENPPLEQASQGQSASAEVVRSGF